MLPTSTHYGVSCNFPFTKQASKQSKALCTQIALTSSRLRQTGDDKRSWLPPQVGCDRSWFSSRILQCNSETSRRLKQVWGLFEPSQAIWRLLGVFIKQFRVFYKQLGDLSEASSKSGVSHLYQAIRRLLGSLTQAESFQVEVSLRLLGGSDGDLNRFLLLLRIANDGGCALRAPQCRRVPSTTSPPPGWDWQRGTTTNSWWAPYGPSFFKVSSCSVGSSFSSRLRRSWISCGLPSVSNGWCRKKRRLVAEEGESSSWVVIEGYHTTNGGINNTYRSDPQRHFSKCFSSSTQYYSDLQQKRSAATSKQLF